MNGKGECIYGMLTIYFSIPLKKKVSKVPVIMFQS